MGVYSTIELTEMECIEKIAEHIGIELDWNDLQKLQTRRTKQQLLSMILFQLTDNNPYSPNHYNNYNITPD